MWVPILLVFSVFACSTGYAETSLQAHAFSGVPHRGANISGNRGAIGGTLSIDHESGLFLGLSGHYAPGVPTGQRLTRYAGANAGWFLPVNGTQAIELSISRHVFDNVPDWRYEEFRMNYHWSKSVTVSGMFSPDYYGRGSESFLTEVVWQPTLQKGWFARFAGGAGLLPDSDQSSLGWMEAGVGIARGRFSTLLSLGATNADAIPSERVDDVTLTLQVNYLIR